MAEVNETQYTFLQRLPNGPTSTPEQTIPQVFEIGPIGLGRPLRDVTTLSDTLHKHKLGIPDVPEVAVKCYFDPSDTTHLQVMSDAVNGALLWWRVNIEEGNSPSEGVVFQAYVVNPQIDSMGVDSDMVLSFSLKPQSIPSDIFVG
jgi:hypothetical protein